MPEQPPVIKFSQTDKVIGGAFRERYLELKPAISLPVVGLPVTNEFDLILNGKRRTAQIFERCAFIFQSDEVGDWRVVSANFDDLALIVQFARINHLI